MKIRLDYVSNSSSSSFIIAYDPNLFGNLEKFFKDTTIGCSTNVNDMKEFLKEMEEDDDYWGDRRDEIKAGLAKAKKTKKKVIYISLDYDYGSIIELLQHINEKCGGDKLDIIYEDD